MSPSDASSIRRTGGCQCGATRFAVTGKPEEVSLCCCRMCQKASGGPFMTMARFASDAVVWTRGQPSTFRSSEAAIRGFCAACGTPMTYQWRPDSVSLTTGTFDDPSDLAPTESLGAESALPWVQHLDALPNQSTDAWIESTPGLADRLRSLQHPDHDT